MNEKAKTIALNIAVTAVIAIVLIIASTQWRQWSQYSKGEAAMAKGDYIAAISGYEAAIHMYTPLSPLVSRSAEQLWQLGQTFERNGDSAGALIAYRSLRSSFYAVRGIYSPGTEWIKRCEARIALLVGSVKPAAGTP
jgi:tetratricopeptide (TPR) repeat protein